jgi:hypothetical protein
MRRSKMRPKRLSGAQIGNEKNMAVVVPDHLFGCDGFRVESREGLLGWVEEAWLGPSGAPVALAIRTIDGRRGLLVGEEIETVVLEHELVVMRRGGRLLELDVPHAEIASVDGTPVVSASWQTTGEVLEPPRPPGPIRRALLALRPWRLAPPPRPDAERPLWQMVAVLYTSLALIVAFVIGLSFLVARLVTGNAV